jgi:HEAT repeat protein
VIVDLDEAQAQLLGQLVDQDGGQGGDEDELISQVVREGVKLVPALLTRVPGRLRVARESLVSGSTRPSAGSSVLRALVALRRASLPFVVVQSGNTITSARLYATLLLGELPYPESAAALGPRFFDPDASVRRSALAATRHLRSSPDVAGQVIVALERVVRDIDEPAERRATAASALGELGSISSVPALIAALQAHDHALQAVVAEALRDLTFQEFGPDQAAWEAWIARAGTGDRVEWLIDALTHESRSLRDRAAAQLRPLMPLSLEGFEGLAEDGRRAMAEQCRAIWRATDKPRRLATIGGSQRP